VLKRQLALRARLKLAGAIDHEELFVLVDGFDRTSYQVTRNAAFIAIAKAQPDRINAWARQRGWSQIALVSGFEPSYQADYKCQGDSDDMQFPVMHVS
jgi:predicted dithiol-disulfide oxidoreductase (DUF899 family)